MVEVAKEQHLVVVGAFLGHVVTDVERDAFNRARPTVGSDGES